MVIKEIAWKNFKSYGNTVNRLKLSTDNGELILLVGRNGSGKTAIGDVLTYVYYGAARAKTGKRAVLSTLPNRMNSELWTSVEFMSGKDDIKIERSMNPNKVNLYENGDLYKKANDKQPRINEWVGFDYDTFNSFISMSINDFKNFMSLPVEDKRKLLDRLFNIEVINTLMKIVKSLRTDNDKQLSEATGEVRALSQNITRMQSAIDTALAKKNLDKSTEIEGLKERIMKHKPIFDEYSTNIVSMQNRLVDVKAKVQKLQEQHQELKNAGAMLHPKIQAYNAGECPTCGSILSDDSHKEEHEQMIKTYEQMKATSLQLSEKLTAAKSLQAEAEAALKKNEQSLSQLKSEITRLKSNLADLKAKDGSDDSAIDEMRNTLKKMDEGLKLAENNVNSYSGMDYIYDRAADVFSEKGVKRQILAKIVKPINILIKQNVDYLGLNFHVELDESFDATVIHNGFEIDPESLSTGETKKINMCIMLAYIEMIRMKRHVNIMFLDEVFASIDMEGIYSVLQMLRRFVSRYRVNVFLVHHSELMESYFDRVIKVEKHVFSQIEEQLNPEPIMV